MLNATAINFAVRIESEIATAIALDVIYTRFALDRLEDVGGSPTCLAIKIGACVHKFVASIALDELVELEGEAFSASSQGCLQTRITQDSVCTPVGTIAQVSLAANVVKIEVAFSGLVAFVGSLVGFEMSNLTGYTEIVEN